MKKTIIFLVIAALISPNLKSRSSPLTVAEQSNFESTSRYDDVISFIESKYNVDLNQYKQKIDYQFYPPVKKNNYFIVFSTKAIYFLVVILILLFSSIYTLRYFFKLRKTTSPKYIQIKEYIKSNLDKGYDISQIKWSLTHSGYSQKLVEKIISELNIS